MVSLLAALMEWVPLRRPVRVKGVEVLTGKEMIKILNEGKFVCRRVKGPAAYL